MPDRGDLGGLARPDGGIDFMDTGIRGRNLGVGSLVRIRAVGLSLGR
ncbi:hypothetical protein [Thermomonospora echinospora]|nr:hypothetical protein [Thermomonospora echinospora]